jgi:hypothetical protein
VDPRRWVQGDAGGSASLASQAAVGTGPAAIRNRNATCASAARKRMRQGPDFSGSIDR